MKSNFKKIFAYLCFIAVIVTPLEAAVITGKVIDSATSEPLIGVNLILVETPYGASTDLDGYYRIGPVKPGDYQLQASILGYDKQSKTVRIDENGMVALDFEMSSSEVKLKDVTIKAQALAGSQERAIEERLQSEKIADALSAEEMGRMPDPDVADVVRRATGVSTMKGDVVIRGLGVRYSKVSLNNAMVAGTEPNRSSVSLELFPSSMMSQVSVIKSYTPDQYGEFGGGVVNMDTWEFPGQRELKASIGTSINSQSTFNDFQTYKGGNLDVLGFDDGTRSLPSSIENLDTKLVVKGRFSDIGLTSPEVENLGESFDNQWSPNTVVAMPNQSYSWSVAGNMHGFGRKIDYMFSNLYRNSATRLEEKRYVYKGGANDQVALQHEYDFDTYKNTVTLGGMGAMRTQLSPFSRLTFNVLYNNELEDETRLYTGYNGDRGAYIEDTRLRFVQQSTVTSQLSGSHAAPQLMKSNVDWRFTFSRGVRYEPDTREVQYESNDPATKPFQLADESQSGSRIFNNLWDNSYNFNLDWGFKPVEEMSNLKLKLGYAGLIRNREAQSRFFQFEPNSFHTVDITQSPEKIFSAQNIGPSGFMVREATRPTDSYDANHYMQAAYSMVETELHPRLRFIGGVRLENSIQEVNSFELFTASATPVTARNENTDILPAATLIWKVQDKMNLRFAGSQTVSRPDFRELSEFEFTDIIGGHAIIGNPELKRALIRNLDLRWEAAHGLGNLIAVSVFYKHFINPVEVVIQPTAQHRVSYENAESANNYGMELELKQRIGDFAVSANWSLLESDIVLSDSTQGIQTSDHRPLHGQSPYLFNAGISYESPSIRTRADLFFNIFGKRIAEVGSKPLPDIYEIPHADLDFTMLQPIGNRLSIKAGVENILNPEHRFEQGGQPTHVYKVGRVFSFGLTYKR
ncbi:TonB-dependent receptor [bacterium]|nr:TonB-dependent receptor [bacterium]